MGASLLFGLSTKQEKVWHSNIIEWLKLQIFLRCAFNSQYVIYEYYTNQWLLCNYCNTLDFCFLTRTPVQFSLQWKCRFLWPSIVPFPPFLLITPPLFCAPQLNQQNKREADLYTHSLAHARSHTHHSSNINSALHPLSKDSNSLLTNYSYSY